MKMHRTLLCDEEGIATVKMHIGNQMVKLNGIYHNGCSFNWLRESLRLSDHSLPASREEAFELLQRMGFLVKEGHSAVNTRNGIKYINPSTVVINKEQ